MSIPRWLLITVIVAFAIGIFLGYFLGQRQ